MTWLWVSTTKPQVHTSSTLCRSWQHDRWPLRHVVTLCDAPRLANAVLVGVPLSGPQRARLGCVVDGPSGARVKAEGTEGCCKYYRWKAAVKGTANKMNITLSLNTTRPKKCMTNTACYHHRINDTMSNALLVICF